MNSIFLFTVFWCVLIIESYILHQKTAFKMLDGSHLFYFTYKNMFRSEGIGVVKIRISLVTICPSFYYTRVIGLKSMIYLLFLQF